MKNESCRPVRKQGDRNIFCPYYGGCLDHAVRQSWDSWECSHCVHLSNQTASPELPWDVNHTVAYYELPTGF